MIEEQLAIAIKTRRTDVRRISLPEPALLRDTSAAALVQAFNSWAFKREQPESAALLLRRAATAVETRSPLNFVLYWGRGPRASVSGPERQCLDFLVKMRVRIESLHPPGAQINLICTDTHADLNGREPSESRSYFAEVADAGDVRGFRTCLLSDVIRRAADRIDWSQADAVPPPDLLEALIASAVKWYGGTGRAEEGAQRYFRANMIERQAVEATFPTAVFVTFNGRELRPLFPPNMPIFYMYSIRKGVAVKPWFMAADAEQDVAP